MRDLIVLLVLCPMLAIGMIYVYAWPNQITVDGGVVFNPTASQCRSAGYELEKNRPPPTAEEIAAREALTESARVIETARTNAIAVLKADSRETTRNLCKALNITPVTNKMSYVYMQERVYPELLASGTNSLKDKVEAVSLLNRLHTISTLLMEERENAP